MFWKIKTKFTIIMVLSVFAFSAVVYQSYSEAETGGVQDQRPPQQGLQSQRPQPGQEGQQTSEKEQGQKLPGKKPGKQTPPSPGLTKGEKWGFVEGEPPGWSKGHKEGWHDMLPPGLQKGRDKDKIKAFKARLKNAEDKIKKASEKSKLSRAERKEALLYMQVAARNGVPPEAASGLVARMVREGEYPESIEKATRAYAYGLDKQIDFNGLGRFVAQKLKEGLRGDSLAEAIYDEIDRRAAGLRVK